MMPKAIYSTMLAALLAAAAVPALAGTPAEHHHAHAELTLRLDEGKRWPTDAPLRSGMAAIRAAIAERAPQIHAHTLLPDEYAQLAEAVDGHVAGIFAECQLPPAADAQLHIVLERMLTGIRTIRDGVAPREGAIMIAQALQAYGDHFDDAGWQPLH